jgi:hypothetical protein
MLCVHSFGKKNFGEMLTSKNRNEDDTRWVLRREELGRNLGETRSELYPVWAFVLAMLNVCFQLPRP